jgi:hypothetical protein
MLEFNGSVKPYSGSHWLIAGFFAEIVANKCPYGEVANGSYIAKRRRQL